MNKPAAHSDPLASAFFCVSLNPAIDTRLILNGFLPGRVNRVAEVYRTPGGKAAHVAMALKGLGAIPTWIGFSGGATGRELLAGLRLLEIENDGDIYQSIFARQPGNLGHPGRRY